MKILKSLLPLVVALIVLGGCRSSRHTERTEPATVVPKPTRVEALSAKMSLTLETGGKKISLGGTYRLKRGQVVQLNLTYTMIFTLSVGTLELTPDYLLVLDRMGKRYCRMTYDELPTLTRAGIDYSYMERVFWGEGAASPTPELTWTYADWQTLGDGQFPGQLQFTLRQGKDTYRATLRLSNLRESDSWEARTEVGAYSQIPFEAILKALMSVAN